jgi:hypothetical protein
MKKIDIDWKHLRSTCGWMLKENASVDIIRSADAIENSIRRKRLFGNKDLFASKYAGGAENREILFTCADEYIHDGEASIEVSEIFSKQMSRIKQHGIFSALEIAATGGDRNVDRAKEVIGKHKGLLFAGGGRAIETAIKELKEEGMAIKYRRKINDYWEVEVVKGDTK